MGSLYFMDRARDRIFGKTKQHDCILPLETAYVCLACRKCQDKAPQGRCRVCGSGSMLSLDALITDRRAPAGENLKKAREYQKTLVRSQPQAAQALETNRGLYLTAPEDQT
jgi:hypothetical protein